MTIYILDGKQMTDRHLAHAHLRRALSLRPYYGNNLDALHDCLTSMPGRATVILTSADSLRDALGAYGDALLRVFDDAARTGAIDFIRASERGSGENG